MFIKRVKTSIQSIDNADKIYLSLNHREKKRS